ncbi:Sphingomyelin phosphodiesterase [Entamoeba marina]
MLFFLTLLSFSTAFQFWQVTDVHYDANYLSGSDPSTVCRSGTGSAGRIGDYSCDTNNFILNSVPKFVQRMSLSKNNRILLYNGDIFPRKIPDYDLDYLKEGLDNATNFLNKFTNFEIIPMLGNHDALPENYHDETTTDVFEYGAKAYSKWLTESAANTFKKGGYYTQKINNAGDDVYVVVLNTVLYYTFNDLTANKVDPIDQFDWFNNTMNTYREEGKTVLLAAHVCPGVSERYNWSQQMYDQYDDRLIDLIADYEDITIGLVCGHLHLDTYRIMKNDEGKVVIGYMSPSLDAYLGINPSVRLYDVEGKTVMNYVNYYVDLSKSYVEWKFNYNAIEEYGLNDLSADSMVELANRMHTDRSLHDIWYHHLRANTDQYSCDDKCYNNNLCAIEHPKNSEISCYEW